MPEVSSCPKCGSKHTQHLNSGIELFDCNSALYPDGTLGQAFACRIRKLESTVARLRKALEYIADPIGDAKRKVKESHGELKLDVGMAITLSDSANHLRGVARTALEETK